MSVIEVVPVAVGIPDSTPAGLKVKRGGGVPALTLHVSVDGGVGLAAVNVKLYGRFTAPKGGAGVALMTGGGGSLIMMVCVLVGSGDTCGVPESDSVTETV